MSAGLRVFVPTLTNESSLLAAELAADPERAGGVTFVGVQFPGIDAIDYLDVHPQARQVAFFMSPGVRRGIAEGRAELLALDYLGIARWLSSADSGIDVAIAQLTTPDAEGWCAAGLTSDFMPLVWPFAKRRVAHLNPRMPRLSGSFRVHVSELDGSVEADTPLLEFRGPPGGEPEARIARQVATLVRDGDTLQFGIGAAGLAVGPALASHRGLRIHGGFAAESLRVLAAAGALDPGARITTGAVLGDASLHAFARDLPRLWLTDVDQTHGTAAIATACEGSRFVAINGAVEVDLFGQVNAERADGRILAGAGGLPAYAHAAHAIVGGRSIVCLGAEARDSRSRIVAELTRASLCTLPRHLADAVVTEHGVAELRGAGLDARAEALIRIAAPMHRDALADAWATLRSAL